MKTKDFILENALDLFAKSGYYAVSIRTIAKSVKIKESSIYYHFKNKQDILDSLIDKYERHINELVDMLKKALSECEGSGSLSWEWMNGYYFEKYLFDPFCNQMMRFMMLEQFESEKMSKLYEYYLFELPRKIQAESFMMLARYGILTQEQAEQYGDVFFAGMTTLTYKYLLCGELTEEKKKAFVKDTGLFIERMF